MADPLEWAESSPYTALTKANLNAHLDAGAVPVTVNGWWRGVDGSGLPEWWDYYESGGTVATTTTSGEWETCGRALKLSGGTAEAYQDLWGLLGEGWRDLDLTVKVRAYRTGANWDVLMDWGTAGTSTVLQGSASDEWEDRAISLTVPATADQALLVLRWTSATGHVLFDRVQVTLGAGAPGWLPAQAMPLVLCEGYMDDDAASWADQAGPRLLVVRHTFTGLSGSSSATHTEDFATVADYWPTGTARTDGGSAGDEVSAYAELYGDEGSGNAGRVAAPGGNMQSLDGKPYLAIASGLGVNFTAGDVEVAALVFQAPHGPDPPERRAYPGGP